MTDPGVTGAPVDVVDEASAAAAGTRTAARWIASALGSIPSLAVLASVVRAPSEAGFDAAELAAGVALAALGGIIAVLGFARVIAPVPLEDSDLRDLDLRRIPGQPYASFDELDRDLADLRAAAVEAEYGAARSLRVSQRALLEAQRAAAAANEAEAAAAVEPGGAELERRARDARRLAEEKQRIAAARELEATHAAGPATWDQQLARRDAIRTKAYRLKAADEVGRRYRQAQFAAGVAVALIAAGIVLLGLAPESNPAGAGG
jgi:hypothetical protein